MTDQQPPLDYAKPESRHSSNPALSLFLFIVGLVVGPAAVIGAVMISDGNSTGLMMCGVLGLFVLTLSISYRPTRALGIGMLCGPPLAFCILFMICSGMKFH